MTVFLSFHLGGICTIKNKEMEDPKNDIFAENELTKDPLERFVVLDLVCYLSHLLRGQEDRGETNTTIRLSATRISLGKNILVRKEKSKHTHINWRG